MLTRRLPLLLFLTLTGSCNSAKDKYTFVLCETGSDEIIGYDSNTKSGGGIDSYGFPGIVCGGNRFKCITFPFNFALPPTSSEQEVYHIKDFTVRFEKADNITKARFVATNRNMKTESVYDEKEGLIRYTVDQNNKRYEYKRCKGNFYVRDMP